MNISDFHIGDYFISSELPLHRGIFYGITCKNITLGGNDLKKNPGCINFERKNKTGHEDEFSLRADELGNVNIGKWIKV
jgi:hypothetical protein